MGCDYSEIHKGSPYPLGGTTNLFSQVI